MRSVLLPLLSLAATGCGLGLLPLAEPEIDTGTVLEADGTDGLGIDEDDADGGSADGGSADGGSGDGGSADGGSADGGSADGGSADGGSADGGSADGGSGDGGTDGSSGSDGGSSGGGSSGGGSSGGGSTGGGGSTDADGDGYDSSVDCDDSNASLNLRDNDGDGYSTCDGDCADSDASTWPGAAWMESSTSCRTDRDYDGYGSTTPTSGATAGSDCDDADSWVNPGAYDAPYDGYDDDCDGSDGGTIVTVSGTGGYIYDYSVTSGEAYASGCSTVYDIEIDVNISHTYIGDLALVLWEPSLTNYVILHYYSGGSTANIVGTYASSGGTLTPYESLSYVMGGSGNGYWYLDIYDDYGGDTGSLNSWTLRLYCP